MSLKKGWDIDSPYAFDRQALNFIKRWWIDIDKINLLLIISIITFGLVMTTTASPYVAKKIDAGNLFFVKKQIIFSLIAIFILLTFSLFNKDQIKIISILGIIGVVGLLVMVALFGSEAKGAKRWITLFGFTLQPSEFAKTFFVIFNAFLLQKLKNKEWFIKYGASMFFYLLIIALLISQPDFGMSLVFSLLWVVQLFLFCLPMAFIALIAFLGIIGAISAYIYLPHVKERINRFLDIDIQNYQVERSIDAYSNGGFFGVGPGNGLVKKYIPDAHTDFIFSVVAEEFGLICCLIVIFIIFKITSHVIKREFKETDMFTYLATVGLIFQFAVQSLVNIGVSLGALPTKGMTLPFISYGGSSIIAMAIGFGVILSLTRKSYGDRVDYDNLLIENPKHKVKHRHC